jgi:hypothetical protein
MDTVAFRPTSTISAPIPLPFVRMRLVLFVSGVELGIKLRRAGAG